MNKLCLAVAGTLLTAAQAVFASSTPAQFDAFLVQEIGGGQLRPDVSGTTVVWSEFVDGDFLVRGKDLATGNTFTIDGPNVGEMDPVTDGKLVVWRDDRAGNFDIFAWDIQTRREWGVINEPHSQGQHALGGQFVVYRDSRNSPPGVPPEFGNLDIYAVDLRTGEEFPVCLAWGNQDYPAADGPIAVWQDARRNLPWEWPRDEIWGYDARSGQEFLIASDSAAPPGPLRTPDISGNIVIWSRAGDIWGKDLSTGETFPICEDPFHQGDPAIDGRYVVWRDCRNATNDNNFDIYGYDLLTGRELAICLDPGDQQNPRISGNLVVWQARPTPGEPHRIYGSYIPEPGSAALLALTSLALLGRRRRTRAVRRLLAAGPGLCGGG